jgi:uncharacterized protein involved in exopolysaccharide biosynthesis
MEVCEERGRLDAVRITGSRITGPRGANRPSAVTERQGRPLDRPEELLTAPKLPGPPGAALDGEKPVVRGVFEPPNSFVLTAIGRHKLIVCVCTVALALAGAAFGLSRPRTYTASATLQVGQVNPNSPGFFSYVQSASALATAFSRSIEAEPVLATIQRKLKLAPAAASSRLSAEPIPVSPAFRVIATGPTRPAAIDLANVTAKAVISYESKSNSSNPEAGSLLHEYSDAAFQLQQAAAKLARLGLSKDASAEDRAHAQAEKTAAEVKLRAIGNSYVGTVASQAPRSGLVSLIAGASSASSDHSSKAEKAGLIGLLVGLIVGCLLAVLRERTLADRRLAANVGEMHRSPSP